MSTEQHPSDQNRPVISNTKPMPQYSISDYMKHAGPIKQMNEWVIEDLRFQLSNTQQQLRVKEEALNAKIVEVAEKETQLKLAQLELSQLKDASITQFGLGLASALLSGIGVNLITSNPPIGWGWGLIGLAALIQLLSFIITYLAKRRKSN